MTIGVYDHGNPFAKTLVSGFARQYRTGANCVGDKGINIVAAEIERDRCAAEG